MTISLQTPTSVFADSPSPFAIYEVELTFRDKILGGAPGNPKTIEAWLRKNMGITDDEELRQMMVKTMLELDMDVRPDMTFEELRKVSEEVAAKTHTTKFKSNGHGLFIEARQVEAMLRESVNVIFVGGSGEEETLSSKALGWGKTAKGAKKRWVEVVTVEPLFIPLGRSEPDGEEFLVKHISGPQGPQSSLAYHEFCFQPVITFQVYVWKDVIAHEHWPLVWQHAELNGLGACRSQSYGRFVVTKWQRIS